MHLPPRQHRERLRSGNPHAYYGASHFVLTSTARPTASTIAKAAQYFAKGADLGDAECQNEIGICYEKGHGVPVDTERARRYYRMSAAQGDDRGKTLLIDLDNLAPSTLFGKTISFQFAPFSPEGCCSCSLQLTSLHNPMDKTVEGLGTYITYGQGPQGLFSYARSYDYQKTGYRTARFIMPEAPPSWARDGSIVHELTFETKTSGTMTYVSKGAWPRPVRAIGRFTVK